MQTKLYFICNYLSIIYFLNYLVILSFVRNYPPKLKAIDSYILFLYKKLLKYDYIVFYKDSYITKKT